VSAHMAALESHLQALPFEQRLELAVLACVTAACCLERTTNAVPAQPAAAQQAAATLVALCQIAVNGVAVVPPVVRTQADRCVASGACQLPNGCVLSSHAVTAVSITLTLVTAS
jgi:hypothetical protein